DGLSAVGELEARLDRRKHGRVLLHGQDRHGMRGLVGEGTLLLNEADRIGEGAAAGNDDRAPPAFRKLGQPVRKMGRSDEAAAQLHDREGKRAVTAQRSPPSRGRRRSISMPTLATGTTSSFSIMTPASRTRETPW